MNVFTATLNQTAFLLLFIVLGYILSRWKFIPENSQAVLSKLENYVFIPALVMGTFMENFTLQKLSSAGNLLLQSILLALIFIGLSLVCARLCSKDRYEQNIYIYGLSFSNFAFMGNAVVSALYPDIFWEYLLFCLPLWAMIYLWGVPTLLMGGSGGKQTLRSRLKSFVNPIFICTLIGMCIGLFSIPMPDFLNSAISAAGSCMSPVAMLLTGMTIGRCNFGEVLKNKGIYLFSALRLIVFPLLFLGVLALCPMPKSFATCAIFTLSMPLGLNTIIIPNAMGRDTRIPAGVALVSHLLSCVTIPLILMLFSLIP